MSSGRPTVFVKRERADLCALLSNGRALSKTTATTTRLRISLFNYFLFSSHCRKSFLVNKPIISTRSSVVRSLYSRMMYPHTLHKSSHSTSNNSHQQFVGPEGNAMPN